MKQASLVDHVNVNVKNPFAMQETLQTWIPESERSGEGNGNSL